MRIILPHMRPPLTRFAPRESQYMKPIISQKERNGYHSQKNKVFLYEGSLRLSHFSPFHLTRHVGSQKVHFLSPDSGIRKFNKGYRINVLHFHRFGTTTTDAIHFCSISNRILLSSTLLRAHPQPLPFIST